MVLQMLFVRFYLVSVESAKHLQIELLQQGQKHFSIVVFKKENKEHKKLNERLSERKEAFRAGKLDQDLSGLKMKPQPFTWEHLVCFPHTYEDRTHHYRTTPSPSREVRSGCSTTSLVMSNRVH
jgi:hypothetical protein